MTTTTSATTNASADDSDSTTAGGQVGQTNKADILFVIDSSGYIFGAQESLGMAIPGFIGLLDDAGADYRVAVTSTDSGHPECAPTLAGDGRFITTSCRERQEDFESLSLGVGAFLEGCGNNCDYQTLQLSNGSMWVEGGPAGSNIESVECAVGQSCNGFDVATVLQCMLPQGIDGCAFEQPLEQLRGAVVRSQTPGDPQEGFFRPDAVPVFIIITNSVDCSYSPAGASIFSPDGMRAFWSDPNAAEATPAVCWNAGVSCEKSPTGSTCEVVDKDASGTLTVESEAVLHPVERYVSLLHDLEVPLAEFVDAEVVVALVAGSASDGAIHYQPAPNAEFQDEFGIGPGCVSIYGEALPPARLAAFADAFSGSDGLSVHSVCEPDYGPAFQTIGSRVVQQLAGP